MTRPSVGLLLISLLVAGPPMARAAVASGSGFFVASNEAPEAGARERDPYDRGTEALDRGDWDAAGKLFQQVVQTGGPRADGALYWTAYVREKQGRRDEALAILREFSTRFPKSSWTREARALELEIRPASGNAVLREDSGDEDLKLMAINSLMNTEPERALPLLEKVLRGPSSAKLKERALFVLAQSGSREARTILADTARGKSGADLQEKAIHWLGVFGRGNGDLLEEIYASSPSPDVKEKVLHAFMVSGNKERLLSAARSEKNPDLRAAAVHQLGVMGARAELWQMYRAETSPAVKDSLIHAMSISGDMEHLLEIARTDRDPEIRGKAIHRLGILGRERSGAALVSIYRSEKDPDLKRSAIQGLFIQSNAKALVEIARSEPDPKLKSEAVQKLSIMRDKDATEYMLEILNR
jgi:hypothetical protein